MQDDDQLYKKLQEKWNVKDVQATKPVDQKEIIRQLIEKSRQRPQFKIKILQDQSDNQRGVLLPDALNKNEQVPLEIIDIVQRNPKTPGVINVGQEMVDTINSSIAHKKRIFQLQKKNFILTQALRGKLGVDLFAISFGIFGLALVPMYFWLKQRRSSYRYMSEMELVAKVNLEESSLDLDDVSSHKTYYNLFTAELRSIINKKNQMNKEINELLGRSS